MIYKCFETSLDMVRVKFIKSKVFFRYHTKGVQNQVLSISDHEIKSYSCSNFSTKMKKKPKKRQKIFRVTKQGNKGITIRAALGISNRGKKITNRGRDFKSGQELQIGAEHHLLF